MPPHDGDDQYRGGDGDPRRDISAVYLQEAAFPPRRDCARQTCTGVVDSDYRGPVKVALHNDGEKCAACFLQEKIAQLVVIPYLEVTFQETDSLDETGRGAGGFGSTGR